jgi:hypothetical protein
MALNLTDLFEEMSSDEKARFDKLTSDDQLKLEKIFAMMAKEKAMKKEVMGIDRKGNEKPDTDGSDATKYKKAARDMSEARIDRDVAERIESFLDRSMKAKFIDAFMDIYSDLLEEDNFFPEDIINHLNNEMHAELAGYQRQGDRLAGMEESYGVTDQDPENDVVNVDKVSSPSAKGTNYGGETSSNDNEDNQEDKEIANPKPMYTENGDVEDFADEISEADPIPTEPGITKMGDDGKEYGVRASNHDRKMAMRNVIDILRDELSVGTDEALDYIRTHKDDLFSGEVDAYDKDEVVADFKEYESVNETSSSDYVDNMKKEKNISEMESLKEHFNRFK